MALSKEFIEQLKSKNEIVEVISAYCQLERRGGAYWARCPLPGHMEKTPSFCVNQAGQFFKCFGCGRGGDVIKFIMEVENLSYIEAIRFLAARANIEMPENASADEERVSEERQKKETSLKILLESARFYLSNLYSPEGKPYLDYMKKRGFSDKILKTFGIGASLDRRGLPRYLEKLGFKFDDMERSGVVSFNKDGNEYVDFEAKRLIVPIIDNMGSVLAFGGRVIEKTDFAKYKNTRETHVFIKNRCLYNINNLKKLRREKGHLDYVIMVEGYMDVIALAEAGFSNVVASMGTSLTVEQARLLMRYTDSVVISYDGDAAGQNATFRGLQILKDAGLDVKVVSLPDGLDPDELIKLRGREAYQALIDEALPLIDYKLKVIADRFDVSTVDGKRKYADNALRVIAESDKDFEREELLKKVSARSRITYESLKRDLEKSPAERSATVQVERATETVTSALDKAESFVLYSCIFDKPYATDDISELDFSSEKRKAIADYIVSERDRAGKVVPATVSDGLGQDYITDLNAIFIFGDGISEATAQKYYSDSVRLLKKRTLESEIADLERYFSSLNDLDERKNVLDLIQKKLKRLNLLKTEDKK